jgi:hypothetical protein
VFRTLGRAGLLGLPYPEEYGGAAQPYEVYTQVVEELARGWLAVGLGVSVHTLSCYPLATVGTEEQKTAWLSDLVGGELLGAYCLSEPQSGSDAAALSTRAIHDGTDYPVSGTKADQPRRPGRLLQHVRVTSDDGPHGSAACWPWPTRWLTVAPAERKMGLKSSTTAQIVPTTRGSRLPGGSARRARVRDRARALTAGAWASPPAVARPGRADSRSGTPGTAPVRQTLSSFRDCSSARRHGHPGGRRPSAGQPSREGVPPAGAGLPSTAQAAKLLSAPTWQ